MIVTVHGFDEHDPVLMVGVENEAHKGNVTKNTAIFGMDRKSRTGLELPDRAARESERLSLGNEAWRRRRNNSRWR